ncbi:MAG TPA: hypothetical protein GX524_00070, partial [Firmicutes bacterium]|nr:hypothetical protein [Bacillota bacterium]
ARQALKVKHDSVPVKGAGMTQSGRLSRLFLQLDCVIPAPLTGTESCFTLNACLATWQDIAGVMVNILAAQNIMYAAYVLGILLQTTFDSAAPMPRIIP